MRSTDPAWDRWHIPSSPPLHLQPTQRTERKVSVSLETECAPRRVEVASSGALPHRSATLKWASRKQWAHTRSLARSSYNRRLSSAAALRHQTSLLYKQG